MIDCIITLLFKKTLSPRGYCLLNVSCAASSSPRVALRANYTILQYKVYKQYTQTTWTCLYMYSLYYLLVNFFKSPLKTQQLEEKPIPCYKFSLFLSLSVALLPLHMFDL